MKGESLEMETPCQTSESAPTRKEWATWCRATCFNQKGKITYCYFEFVQQVYAAKRFFWKKEFS